MLVLSFIAFSYFRCMLKDRKLAPGQPRPWLSGVWIVLHGSRVRLPCVLLFFLRFFQVFLKVFRKLGLGLVLALRLVLGLG